MSKFKKALAKISPGVLILAIPALATAAVNWGQLLNPTQGLYPTSVQNLTNVIRGIVQILLILAGVVALLYLIWGGYQYVTAGGNAEQAAAARTTILNAIIGLIIIFASYAIISFVLGKFL